jgi:putative transcriptional regulator
MEFESSLPGEQRVMSEENTTKFRLDEKTPPRLSRSKAQRLDSMSDEDIEKAALSDSDNPPLTDEELAAFERVPDAKAIRQALRLTQREFAITFQLSLATVRDWEQGRYQPDQAARTLLRVIARAPKAVKRALEMS